MEVEEQKEIKPLNITDTKSKFKQFTNGTVLPDVKDFQPYLGKLLILNIDEILSIYPAEDGVGTQIHAKGNQGTWKVLEDIDTVLERVSNA